MITADWCDACGAVILPSEAVTASGMWICKDSGACTERQIQWHQSEAELEKRRAAAKEWIDKCDTP